MPVRLETKLRKTMDLDDFSGLGWVTLVKLELILFDGLSVRPALLIKIISKLQDEEEAGSKRARRDSSSSLGSSLSMEMPPLFSNGVVGQTTSHLVSRETDLSLNSLLSRSQSIFGHSNAAASAAVATLASNTQTTNHQPTPKMYPSMQHNHTSQTAPSAAATQR